MSHLAAFDALPAAQREAWSRLATVNAYSGAVHPLVHLHPRTGRRTLFVHLGQTGAVARWPSAPALPAPPLEAMDPAVAPSAALGHRLLGRGAVRRLAGQLEALLSSAPHRALHTYRQHDLLLLDNLAVSHRAASGAHDAAAAAGLRVLHHTPRCEAGTRSTRRPSLSSRPSRTSGARAPPAWARAAACGRPRTTRFRWNATARMRN
mmetsp:Transcript_17043/g.54766  ORF Transcript_17043/g.54766 Transcript_17043/m.54766 type:complete len:207 (-) Transcript_17043:352-972(-)